MILCSWSEVFEKMMGEEFRENTTKKAGGKEVVWLRQFPIKNVVLLVTGILGGGYSKE